MLTRSNYSICPRTCSKEVWEARCEQLQAAPDIVHTCVFRAGRKQSSEEIADRAVNTAVQSWRPRDLELQLHTHHYIEIQWRNSKGKFRNASKRSMLSWGCFSLMPQLMVSIARNVERILIPGRWIHRMQCKMRVCHAVAWQESLATPTLRVSFVAAV